MHGVVGGASWFARVPVGRGGWVFSDVRRASGDVSAAAQASPNVYRSLREAGYHTLTAGKDDLEKKTYRGNSGHPRALATPNTGADALGFSDASRTFEADLVGKVSKPFEPYGRFLDARVVRLPEGSEAAALARGESLEAPTSFCRSGGEGGGRGVRGLVTRFLVVDERRNPHAPPHAPRASSRIQGRSSASTPRSASPRSRPRRRATRLRYRTAMAARRVTAS